MSDSPGFDVDLARAQFPALARTKNGQSVLYADGPSGTQVAAPVIEAMAGYMERGGSNLGEPSATSMETDELVHQARSAAADLFGAGSSNEIVFGQNMTSLTLAMGRALARTWQPGDEIVVTRLDHDANVSSWMQAASEADVTVRQVPFDAATGRLEPAAFELALSSRTRLVAVTHASNALGTIVDVAAVAELAHAAGALVYVDAVHYTPHRLVDVVAVGADFLAASSYKFFGPHTGILYGRSELLSGVEAVKIRPAPSDPPGKWETGTQSFESLAGVTAAVGYLEQFGSGATRRERIASAMAATTAYELTLTERFLAGVAGLSHVRVFGVDGVEGRVATFAVGIDGMSSLDVAKTLAAEGIFVSHGHYYALEVMQSLGVLDDGGLVRIGFMHYTTSGEVDRVLAALRALG